MAKVSQTKIEVKIEGDGASFSYKYPVTPFQNPAAPSGGGPTSYTLASGDNTINVPPGSQGFLLAPPTTSTFNKRYGGASGGVLRPNAPSTIFLPDSQTTIVINSAGIETVGILWL